MAKDTKKPDEKPVIKSDVPEGCRELKPGKSVNYGNKCLKRFVSEAVIKAQNLSDGLFL